MVALVVGPLPGAGTAVRLTAWVRGRFSTRLLLRLSGIESVVLEGRAYAVRAVPLGVARDLVPAILRCGDAIAACKIDDALYDNAIKALSLGLGVPPRSIESLTISLWEVLRVLDLIARVNGLQAEADKIETGKLLAALTSTGTKSTLISSAPPAGPGNTSMPT